MQIYNVSDSTDFLLSERTDRNSNCKGEQIAMAFYIN